MVKKIRNIDTVAHTWGGQGIEPGTTYSCTDQTEANKFGSDDLFATALAGGLAEVYKDDTLVSGVATALGFLKTGQYEISSIPATASKTLADGKKIYKRVVGIRNAISQGPNEILWTCPFAWVKFLGVEFTGTKHGDYVDLFVLDKTVSPLYGVPDAVLNQFGFEANMFEGDYQHKSEFDADLYQDLKIKIVYNSIDTKSSPLGINFIMNEVK